MLLKQQVDMEYLLIFVKKAKGFMEKIKDKLNELIEN